jgi:Ca-activated chloride channel family protein
MEKDNFDVNITPLKQVLVDSAETDLKVLVRVAARAEHQVTRTPLSIALVIDRSGSMRGERLSAAKSAAKRFVDTLGHDDEVCLVAYDDEIKVPLPLSKISEFRPLFPEILSSFGSGGSTDLHAGWLEGAQQLAPKSSESRMCRVILLSDGKANRGLQNITDICDQVSQLARAGITTTTVGIGLDFNEHLMTEMALAGQGAAMYGDRAEDLFEPLEAEVGLLKNLAWHDVSIQVQGESSHWTVHNPYVSLGVGSWQIPSLAINSEAWVALSIPMRSAIAAQQHSQSKSALQITIKARDADGKIYQANAELPNLEVVSATTYEQAPINELVNRRFNELEAAQLKREAYRAARMRQWNRLSVLLDKLEARTQDNPWLLETVAVLRRLLEDRDQARLEKELMYSSHSLSSRLTELDESMSFSRQGEIDKAAFLRRKIQQGRRSTSEQ